MNQNTAGRRKRSHTLPGRTHDDAVGAAHMSEPDLRTGHHALMLAGNVTTAGRMPGNANGAAR
jgi:hypothetical protein